MADLIIRISGDASNFKKALEDAEDKTSGLSDQLEKMAKASAVAFAALTAEAFLAVKAFAESEEASNRLTNALQQQGIYSKELAKDYRDIATEIQRKTGIDDDSVKSGIAQIQSMIGQTKVTQELANAVVDLAAYKKIDLNQAFELVGKAATNGTEVLKRYGFEIQDAGSKEENLVRITETLTNKIGGTAEAANSGLGSIQGLKSAFGDLQEEIGSRLAPAVTVVIKKTTEFFNFVSDNPALLDFIVSVGVAGAAVAGIGTVLGVAGMAFLKLKAALEAAKIATTALSVATTGLAAATGIGILLVIATEVYLNWAAVWPRVQGVFAAFVKTISELGQSLGTMLRGIFNMDMNQVKEGLAQAKAAFSKGAQEYNTVVDEKLKERQAIEDRAEEEKVKKNNANAAAEEARLRERAQRQKEIEAEKRQLLAMEAEGATADALKLQQDEIKVLEQIHDEKNQAIVGKLKERLERIRAMQDEQHAVDRDKARIFQEEILAENEEFEAMSDEQKAMFLEKNQAALTQQILTEKTARTAAAEQALKEKIQQNNQYLLEQQKFGTAYATINSIMHSEVYKGSKQAFGELAQLQSSSNSTLKGIGKIAAIANITIKTAESAMNIYAGFSTIPIIGPALGIAGAAAAVLFGAEQMSRVTSAAQGGLITGGTPGIDSVPAMLMPGEVVVPARNFEETIMAVAQSRGLTSSEVGGSGPAHVILELKDGLMDFIEAKQIERQSIGISFVRG